MRILLFIVMIAVNINFLIFWIIEFLKSKSKELLENPVFAKKFEKVLVKMASLTEKKSINPQNTQVSENLKIQIKSNDMVKKRDSQKGDDNFTSCQDDSNLQNKV